MPVSDEQHDREMAVAAAVVQHMDEQLRAARHMLAAAAISARGDLVIYDGALARVDMYETETWRDEAESCVRIRVRPKA